MLVLSQISTCDVCLEHYSIESAATSKPYVLQCGHTFCRQCLNSICENQCPLCGAHFNKNSTVRLRVDLITEDVCGDLTNEELHARNLESQLLHAGNNEDISSIECQAMMFEAEKWLKDRPSNAHQALRSALDLLRRLKGLQQQFQSALYPQTFRNSGDRDEDRQQRTLDIPMAAPAMLIVDSDWAKIEVETPGVNFCRDPRATKPEVYEDVTLTETSIMWAGPHRELFSHVEIPFCVISSRALMDVKITHGRDRYILEDQSGEASLKVLNITYRNDTAYGWWSAKHFSDIPVIE